MLNHANWLKQSNKTFLGLLDPDKEGTMIL
jgi:hypothetical protein